MSATASGAISVTGFDGFIATSVRNVWAVLRRRENALYIAVVHVLNANEL